MTAAPASRAVPTDGRAPAIATPRPIADFLARWAIGRNPNARVLNPGCADPVFLEAAAERLAHVGATSEQIATQLIGVDPGAEDLRGPSGGLRAGARLVSADFLDVVTPAQIGDSIGWQDAVVGNPPFVRYSGHDAGERRRWKAAALAQGVRLTGQASSWAATLVHAGTFLEPSGRMAMVVPSELLNADYAEPVRRWLRRRFSEIDLYLFERPFPGSDQRVLLLTAHGRGPCDGFGFHCFEDPEELGQMRAVDKRRANVGEGRWSNLLVPGRVQRELATLAEGALEPLGSHGAVELGTITGSNDFFLLDEATRESYAIGREHVLPLAPTRSSRAGFAFDDGDWERLRSAGERVWMFYPRDLESTGVRRYIEHGEQLGVPLAYRCKIRTSWWRVPLVLAPDLFLTYASHRFPRLIENRAGAVSVNSLHAIRLRHDTPAIAREALPLLAMNSLTLLGAELAGRPRGGGALKLEPSDAARLLLPSAALLERAWPVVAPERDALEAELRAGATSRVVARIDRLLLRGELGLSAAAVDRFAGWASRLRQHRMSAKPAAEASPAASREGRAGGAAFDGRRAR